MNLADLGAIIVVNLVGAASPGPDIVLITRTATRSRRHALATVAGIQVGVLMWCTLTVLGAAALLTAFPWVLEFVQIIGGAWLIYLGVSSIRGGLAERHNPPSDTTEAESRLGRLRHSFAKGLTTNLSNPKIVLFLAALVAPLLPPNPSLSVALIVIAALWIPSWIFQAALATLVSTHAVRNKLLRAGPYIDIGAGVFFVVAAVVLIVRGATGLLG
ncbi:LysE family translocator [Corynebacterium pilosum]|uniref:Arginine exporter n=1 Tax=Corynebacterium pilosum TaxID=35756 RepID=A0A376CK14_9CORY|nr:LysE family translocator [Corynebacterium pilosum]STC68612.1 arginine exporter [Corynebacterium pilosum]